MSCRHWFAIPRWVRTVVPLICVAVLGLAGLARAQNVVHVEEDWELVLGGPDANTCGPQIATAMSPFSNINDTYFTMEINHRSAPTWSPGGISIHRWAGEWRMESYDRSDRSVMNTNSEVVTWTQVLDVHDHTLKFQIKDGASTTWGPFGYSSNVKLTTGWGVNNINSYSTDVSVSQSGAAYAGNRVQSLKIKCVRRTLDIGVTLTDNTERIVQQLVVE
jgi:hypothetical protein